MGVVKKTIVELLLVLAVGTALGFGLNPLRGSDRVQLNHDYFPDYTEVVEQAKAKAVHTGKEDSPADAQNTETDNRSESNKQEIDPRQPVAPPENPPAKKTRHPDHPYQDMTFDQAADIYENPDTELGVYVFIDARNDEAFADGHIPGALQCDRYRIEAYIGPVLEAAMQAEKVIVYCNGGDCPDSKALCGELIQRGIPYDKVFLFSGGWEEWKAHMMPYDTGGVD